MFVVEDFRAVNAGSSVIDLNPKKSKKNGHLTTPVKYPLYYFYKQSLWLYRRNIWSYTFFSSSPLSPIRWNIKLLWVTGYSSLQTSLRWLVTRLLLNCLCSSIFNIDSLCSASYSRGGNYTVTQTTFDSPCRPHKGGFDSGLYVYVCNEGGSINPCKLSSMPVVSEPASGYPNYTITVNNTQSLWAYCRQTVPLTHCSLGMVFSVNDNGRFTMFQAGAASTTRLLRTSSRLLVSRSGGGQTFGSINPRSAADVPPAVWVAIPIVLTLCFSLWGIWWLVKDKNPIYIDCCGCSKWHLGESPDILFVHVYQVALEFTTL